MTTSLAQQRRLVLEDRVALRLVEAERALRLAGNLDQVRLVMDAAAAQKVFARRQGLSDAVISRAHRIETYALARLGELLLPMEKAKRGAGPGRGKVGTKAEPTFGPTLKDLGIDRKVAAVAQQLARLPKVTREKIADRKLSLAEALREQSRRVMDAHLAELDRVAVEAPTGRFDVIVIDPPWDAAWVERKVRPRQVGFDYPLMSEAKLRALQLPMARDCHVWLWTIHSKLPLALALLEAWGLDYDCTFVWHKPGGFQRVGGPQKNCELALYARKGTPVFRTTKGFSVCFSAPRGKHSEKPEFFYTMVRRVTAGQRLDMFNRRPIDGFDGWGQEATG